MYIIIITLDIRTLLTYVQYYFLIKVFTDFVLLKYRSTLFLQGNMLSMNLDASRLLYLLELSLAK